MLDTVFGLPVHPLIVHATTVLVPAAALSVLLAVVWPRFRRWFSWGPVALSLVAVVLVPLTTQSGESLEHKMQLTDLIRKHAELADALLPWVIALAVGAIGLCYWQWRSRPSAPAAKPLPRWLVAAISVVCLAAGIGTLVEVVLIGHSGAVAAWSGTA